MPPVLTFILAATLIIGIFARRRFRAVYARHQLTPAACKLTGAEVARKILASGGLEDEVAVVEHRGMLMDHYDASRKRLVLSQPTYSGSSRSAMAIAAHEAAHALQHQDSFTPLSLRLSAVKMCQVLGGLMLILTVLGFLFRVLNSRTAMILLAATWGGLMIFNILTLPVEFEASRRAKKLLKKLRLIKDSEESDAVSKVLGAAPFMYVGALIGSVPFLVYNALPFLGRTPKK